MKSCCHYVAERVERYLDGELPATEVQIIRQNMQACPECRALIACLERLNTIGKFAFYKEPGEAYWNDLTARITAAIAPETATPSLWERFRAAAVSAVDALAVPRPALGFAAAAAVLLIVLQVAFQPFYNPFTMPADQMTGLQDIQTLQGTGHTDRDAAEQPAPMTQTPAARQSTPAGQTAQNAAAPQDETQPATAAEDDAAALARLERINPLREPFQVEPLRSDESNATGTSTIAGLSEEPGADNQRIKRDGSLLSEGGIPQADENATTFTLQSGRADQRGAFSGPHGDRQQAASPSGTTTSDISRLTVAELSVRRDQLLASLKTEKDPLVRNITIKHLDDVYVALLNSRDAEQYRSEARNFYVTYQETLTALLGTQLYQGRFLLLER